jgi:hypothetical protein
MVTDKAGFIGELMFISPKFCHGMEVSFPDMNFHKNINAESYQLITTIYIHSNSIDVTHADLKSISYLRFKISM